MLRMDLLLSCHCIRSHTRFSATAADPEHRGDSTDTFWSLASAVGSGSSKGRPLMHDRNVHDAFTALSKVSARHYAIQLDCLMLSHSGASFGVDQCEKSCEYEWMLLLGLHLAPKAVTPSRY